MSVTRLVAQAVIAAALISSLISFFGFPAASSREVRGATMLAADCAAHASRDADLMARVGALEVRLGAGSAGDSAAATAAAAATATAAATAAAAAAAATDAAAAAAAAAPTPAAPANAVFSNRWAPSVHVLHAREVDLRSVPLLPASGQFNAQPSWVLSRGDPESIENFQLLLSSRILRGAPGGPAHPLIDIGCNSGTYTFFWASLAQNVYCVDVELLGGPSGVGAFRFETLRHNPGLIDRVTLFPMGISVSSDTLLAWAGGHNYAKVASLADAKGVVSRTATFVQLMGQLPEILLTKIDVDGAEISAIESILAALRAGRRVLNIIVELTPMWWSSYGYSFDAAMGLLGELLSTHDVYVSYWREASQLCCGNPHSTPPALVWDSAPLEFVQQVNRSYFRAFLAQMAVETRKHGQRDFWFRSRQQTQAPGLANGVDLQPLRCEDISLYASSNNMPCARHHG
jgi:hypothetical protein